MKSLSKLLTEYIEARRALGFKAEREVRFLSGFISFLRSKGSSRITTEHALAWARRSVRAHPAHWAQRLSMVRIFAEHVCLVDPRHEIPPSDLLPRIIRRATPFIYSSDQIVRLLRAAVEVHRTPRRSPFRAMTYKTLFALLAATGMRVGEAIRLDCGDVDWRNQLLIVRESKFGKSREVVLHTSIVRALHRYANERDRRVHLKPRSPSFLVSLTGTRLIHANIFPTFKAMLRHAGIKRAARIHDLRHTFAVRTILRWHRHGVDVDARMPVLSTYLGHRAPSSTYWYLTSTPELMALVAKKVQRALTGLP